MKKSIKVLLASIMMLTIAFVGFSSFKGSEKKAKTADVVYVFTGSSWEPSTQTIPELCSGNGAKCAIVFSDELDPEEAISDADNFNDLANLGNGEVIPGSDGVRLYQKTP